VIDRLLPRRIDNSYRGHRIALWLFALLLFMKLAMSVNSILNASTVASSADGIPLDTYPPDAARTIVSLFALLGLSHLVICVLCLLVLVRYRSLIPFMFALLLLEHLSRRLILRLMPILRTGTPPGFYVNLALLAVMLVGLALSLRRRRIPPSGMP
jgi:MYXO-CTERM domain-containing protein